MLFIIEGVDGGGKTTLINELIKKFPGVTLKITDRPTDASVGQKDKIITWYWKIIEAVQIMNGGRMRDNNFILDRFFPSEMVYSAKRGYDGFLSQALQTVENKVASLDHMLVYCDPGLETIHERVNKRGDDYVVSADLDMLHARYELFFKNTQLNKIKVDTTKPVEECLELIQQAIKNEYPGRKSK